MKKFSLLLLSLIMTLVMNAQPSGVEKLFNKYGGKDGFTTVKINKEMFELLGKIDKDDKDIQSLAKIEYLRVLAVEDGNALKGVNFYDEVMRTIDKSEYEELLRINESDTDVKILIRQAEDGTIHELLIVAGGEGDDNALVYIKGNIKLNELSGLSDGLSMTGIDGLETLEALEEVE